MLSLVAEGFENIVLSTMDFAKTKEWLIINIGALEFNIKELYVDESHGYTLVYLQKDSGYEVLSVPHNAAYTLNQLFMNSDIGIIEARTLPKTIFMNMDNDSDNVKEVLDMVVKEIGGIKFKLIDICSIPSSEGALICLVKDNEMDYEIALTEGVYIDSDYIETLDYLKVHSSRYFNKFYSDTPLNMVDIMMYDKYEKYSEQYHRIKVALNDLKIGYIVNEQWNTQMPLQDTGMGSYEIRILTFLTPLEFKTYLLALEYDREGKRIVDLDLLYKGKKVSWRDIMEDKHFRKRIVDDGVHLSKSIFFAEDANKAALLEYALKQLEKSLSKEVVESLRNWESGIDN